MRDLVERMRGALLAEDPEASILPYCLSGGTDNKALEALGVVAGRWPVVGDSRRWRLGELSVAWDAVAPASRAQRSRPSGPSGCRCSGR